MLLAIVSKMSKEGLLNNQQKGKTNVPSFKYYRSSKGFDH